MTDACPCCGALASEAWRTLAYPAAGSTVDATLLPDGIRICPDCGFGVAVGAPDDEALARYYAGQYWDGAIDGVAAPRRGSLASELSRLRVEMVKAEKPDGAWRILDVGAGPGTFGLAALGEPGLQLARYIAVEPDPTIRAGIAAAWPNGAATLETYATLGELPTGTTANLVVSSHVLEHVMDPAAFLTAICARLEPGGYIVVDVPNADWRFKPAVFPHLGFFTLEAMSQLLIRQGLEICKLQCFGSLDMWRRPALPRRALNKLRRTLNGARAEIATYEPARHRADGPWIRGIAKLPLQ
ncbi:MAG: class I SAM-dependent methyltransferase [Pseudomonadota bacterium]